MISKAPTLPRSTVNFIFIKWEQIAQLRGYKDQVVKKSNCQRNVQGISYDTEAVTWSSMGEI